RAVDCGSARRPHRRATAPHVGRDPRRRERDLDPIIADAMTAIDRGAGEPVEPTTEERLRVRARPDLPTLAYQEWHHLLFLHWQVDAAPLAARLPSGLDL